MSGSSDATIADRMEQLKELIAALEHRVGLLETACRRTRYSQGSLRGNNSSRSNAPGQPASDFRQRVEELDDLFSSIESRLDRLEGSAAATKHPNGSIGETEQRLLQELQQRGVNTARFVRVPSDYYEHPLEYRQRCLAANSVQQLCKSIVLENTKAPADFPDCGSFERSRYYCVIVQYAARLHTEKLKRYLHKLNGTLGIKNFNMRLAPAKVSDRLTGFTHNAVTPICMRTRLPIVLSHRIAELEPPFFWLGAGETDLKVGLSVTQFLAAYQPLVIDCSYEEEQARPMNENCLST